MNAIGFFVVTGIRSVEIEQRIKELREDDAVLDGFSVSDFAIAALHLAGVEKYAGSKTCVEKLIVCRFDFLK